jgi:arylsulfatase A-like enzyme
MPPNILLIFSDQHRYDCLAAHGHPFLATPNLDRLAAEGASFPHAFTPIPICVPARASLLTGQWPTGRLPHGHQALANTDSELPRPLRTDLPTFTQALHDAGYWLGMAGKWQVHPELGPTSFGFDEYRPDSAYPAWRAAQGLPPKPHTNSWFGEPDPAITPEQSRLGWGASQAIELIQQGAAIRAASGKPFFVRWDPSEPHLPNIVPEPYASLYPPEQVPPWPGFDDPLDGKPYIQKKMRRSWGIEGWTWPQWAPTVARYLGEISLLDAQVGRLLAELDRLGLAESTLVVYTCDHGDLCGSHGMIDKHNVLYDDVLRVPLLMRWPGVIPAGARPPGFTSHAIDLATTFLAAASMPASMPGSMSAATSVPIPPTFTGLNLLDQLSTASMPGAAGSMPGSIPAAAAASMSGAASIPGRADIFATYHGSQFGLYSQRAVRDVRWKFIWNATAEDELYDLQTDPGELHNRALDPACQPELARLRARLLAWMEQIDDPLLNQWTRRQLSS